MGVLCCVVAVEDLGKDATRNAGAWPVAVKRRGWQEDWHLKLDGCEVHKQGRSEVCQPGFSRCYLQQR